MAKGPLSNLKVLDLCHVWAGPLATRILSDLGAQVVKVERSLARGPKQFPATPLGGLVGSEPITHEPWNRSAVFVKLARNAASLCLDLKSPDGRRVFLELVEQADVVMENFSARAMDTLGLSYAVMRQRNPRLVYLSMPGFGSSGPYTDRVAFGPVIEPMSGLDTVMGYNKHEPRNTAMALPDPIGALTACSALLTALRERQSSNEGKHIELSLHESAVNYSGPWLVETQLGRQPEPMANRHPQMAPHGVYPCAGNDHWIALACPTDAHWHSLCTLLGDNALGDNRLESKWNLLARQQREDLIDERIRRWTGSRGAEQAATELQAANLPAGMLNTTPDFLNDAQVRARKFFVPLEAEGTPVPGLPINMDGLDSSTWTPCPKLGANNADVLQRWLGYSDDQIAALEQAGTLMDKPST